MASITDRDLRVERYNRKTRWFHALTYVTVLVLLFTGGWLWLGQEGKPSVLADVTRIGDAELHTNVGWALTAIAGLGVLFGSRAITTLVRESSKFRRGEVTWVASWPRAVVTGRFARHEGHFDPGQRVANFVIALLLLALIGSGVGLVLVSGGPMFVWFGRIHRWATYLFIPVLAGHVVIASGLLPGYRGVWRSMHLGGRLRQRDAARVWPGWFERSQTREREQDRM